MQSSNNKNSLTSFCLSLGLIIATAALSACSVGMALNGKKEPDLSVVKQNATRTDIEIQLGVPTKVVDQPDGKKIATYEYDIGQESSTGRAVAHGAMDVLTLGIWEIIGTPVEACKGDRVQMDVTYDHNDHLISAHKKIIK